MNTISNDELSQSDLQVDAIYEGGRKGNAGDDPLHKLMGVSIMGGFRYLGTLSTKLNMLVLTTSMNDPDWPDALDPETGFFTYYGDNKEGGQNLHKTKRFGNLILSTMFENAHAGQAGRELVPPVFVFASAGVSRDVRFLGLAVPGGSDLDTGEDLVAIWRSTGGVRFQNYRARFTILDAALMSRAWIDSMIAGKPDHSLAPEAWQVWQRSGRRTPLLAPRTRVFRNPKEQMPRDDKGKAIIATIWSHFSSRPHAFEHCAAALARMMIPEIAALDVTRPSRDHGRDGVGYMRIGSGPSGILVDFALEAKCYGPKSAVGAEDMSRLISRLRHRQFGVIVTTSYVTPQIYEEIKEDEHPIVVIAAQDIVEILRRTGRGSVATVQSWLSEEYPPPDSQT